MLEAERVVLSDMNAILAKLMEEQSEMRRQREERKKLLDRLCAAGITALEMETHKNFLLALDFSLKQKAQQIALQRQAIYRQMEKVRDVKLEISTIEKLRERKQEEYDYLAHKEEEQLIEEYVTTSKAMANC
ncbi:MAG TPA: hypothetical protein GX499_10355 [Clostridiales bacterium]|nr:hypothetical protein [Clostridiales bacterium]